MKNRRLILNRSNASFAHSIFVAAIALLLAGQSARATDLYWDLNQATDNPAGPTALAGAWNGTAINWNSDPLGGAAGTTTAVTTATDRLFFSSGTNYSGSGTVTVTGTQSADSITFEEGTVTVSGGTAVALGASSTISVASGLTATLNPGTVPSTTGLTKTGAGNLLFLTNNTANTGFTGTVSIKSGAVAAGSNTSGVSNATNGQLISLGESGSSDAATFSVNRNQNYNSSVTVNPGPGIRRLSGGPGLSGNQQPSITSPIALNGDLTLGNGAAGIYTGNNFGGVRLSAAITGSSKIIADGFNAYTNAQDFTLNINTSASATQAKIAANNGATFTGNVDVVRGALTIENSGALGTNTAIVTTSTSAVLNLNRSSPGIAGLNNGASIGGSVGNLASSVNGTSGSSTLSLRGSGTYVYAGTIVDGNFPGAAGNWPTALTVNLGTGGSQQLDGANAYGGATTVTAGLLKLGNALALGTSNVATRYASNATSGPAGSSTTTVQAGGVLDLNGQSVSGESLVLNGTGDSSGGALINSSVSAAALSPGINTVTLTDAGSWVTANGTLAGPPTVTPSGGGGTGFAATAVVGLAGGLTTSGGTGYTTAPTVTITGGGGTGMSITTSLSSGAVVFTIANPGTGYTSVPTFSLAGGAGGTGASIAAGSLGVVGLTISSYGTGYSSAPTLTIDSTGWTFPAAATATYSTFDLASNASIGGSGDIAIAHAIGGATFGIEKVGAGTLTLSGSSTYTGATTISAGTLSLATPSLANISTVSIITGAHLNLTHGATDDVAVLEFDGIAQADGIYNSSTPGGFITGSGSIRVITPAGYSVWASTNANNQTANQDFDNDGVKNGVEYFLGESGSSFTANPSVVGGTVTWTNGGNIPSAAYGTQYVVQTSSDLVTWTPASVGAGPGFVTTNTSGPGGSLTYTLPTGAFKIFARLVVTPN